MLHADLVADRRRLKRSQSFWRILAIVIAVLAIVGLLSYATGPLRGPSGAHIATLSFKGVIHDDEHQLELIDEIAEDENVKAVVLVIDSPGGTVTGSELIYGKLAELAGRKPVVSVFRSMGTSGAYAVALAGERIFAQQTSIVGSIGVIFQWAEVSGLMETIGVDVNSIKSAPLKAEPQPFDPIEPEARAMIERLVAGSLEWFIDILDQNRPFNAARARALANGAIYTGAEALDLGLVDELGGTQAAKTWLIANKGLDPDLPLVDREPEAKSGLNPLDFSMQTFAEFLGLSIKSGHVSSSWGLMAIWYPPGLDRGMR